MDLLPWNNQSLDSNFRQHPTDNSRLCKACLDLVSKLDGKCEHGLDVNGAVHCIHDFHPSVDAFSNSVRAGCPLCTMLWDVLSTELPFMPDSGSCEFVSFKYRAYDKARNIMDLSERYLFEVSVWLRKSEVELCSTMINGTVVHGAFSC
jgi:hypothetical protein